MACGGARDLLGAVDAVKSTNATVVLNDIDGDALALCRERFPDIDIKYMPGNALKMTGEFVAAGPFDLIVCGGLFDYVPDSLLQRMLPAMITRMLAPEGTLFFTNVAKGNPYRTWMEHFGNWRLIERSEATIRKLCSTRVRTPASLEITMDPTGLTFLVDVRKVAGDVAHRGHGSR
jgi:ubiquinone/menaquinone biosynthesis C-methylase UbiE